MAKTGRISRLTEDKSLLTSLGKRIRQIRLEKNLTQEQLGQGDFSKSYLSAVELGKIEPSLRALRLLAERLGISLSYLLDSSGTELINQASTITIAQARFALEGAEYARARDLLQSLNTAVVAISQKREAKYLEACALAGLKLYDQAIANFLAARKLWQETGFSEWLARIDMGLGEIHLYQKLYGEAQTYLDSALEAVRNGTVSDYYLTLKIIKMVAKLYQETNEREKLSKLFDEVENLTKYTPSNPESITLLAELAQNCAEKDDFLQARILIERAIGIRSSLNFARDFIRFFWLFGATSEENGQTAKALTFYNSGLAMTTWHLADPEVVNTYNKIARLILAENNLEGAKEFIQKAKQTLDLLNQQGNDYKAALGQIYVTEAQIADLEGKPDETERLFQSAETLLEGSDKQTILPDIYYEHGNSLLKRGRQREGYTYIRKAVELRS
jgi:transcriptional regulator with XRE-family HTH domain